MKLLSEHLSLSPIDENKDIHRVIMHYCYENYKNHVPKYDNYVALYGFLRSLSLLLSSMFVYCLWIEVLTIDIHSDVDWLAICVLVLLLFFIWVS